jgi:hypothetical protein
MFNERALTKPNKLLNTSQAAALVKKNNRGYRKERSILARRWTSSVAGMVSVLIRVVKISGRFQKRSGLARQEPGNA